VSKCVPTNGHAFLLARKTEFEIVRVHCEGVGDAKEVQASGADG